MNSRFSKATFSVLVALLVLGQAEAGAECVSAPELAAYQGVSAAEIAAGAVHADRRGRVIAPVRVNGQGPFRFVVDTGANRSVLSEDLAGRLGLTPEGTGDVHSVFGVSTAPLLQNVTIEYGGLALGGGAMPMLGGGVFAGEMGLLGANGMSGRRLLMDFEHNCIEIAPAGHSLRWRGWSAIQGDIRFGHLIVMRGNIRGVEVNLIIDTGSDTSLANLALRDVLAVRLRRPQTGPEAATAYTAGDPVLLDAAILVPYLTMGGVTVSNIAVFVGDFHIFHLWGLDDEPTLLLGMDVLSRTSALAIDYERALVHIRIRSASPSTDVGGAEFLRRADRISR